MVGGTSWLDPIIFITRDQGNYGGGNLLAWLYYFYRFSDIMYRKVSNIRHTLAGNEIVDHSDVVEAPPVGAAPTTSSFPT